MRATWRLICCSLLAGCAAPKATPTTQRVDAPPIAGPSADVAPPAPLDAEHVTKKVFQIALYQLTVPQGSISANATFWKPFDETFLGLWQHDVLAKNGLRVGRAAFAELGYLSAQLDDAEQMTTQNVVGRETKDTEITVRKDVAEQVLFYFDKDGQSAGQNFARCDDLFAISFRQTAREQDHVRIRLAPMIRAQQSKLEITNPLTLQARWVKPQTLYELGITMDLGVGECVVLAPNAAAAENKTLVGRQFLMEERPSELVEKVLVIRPTIARTLTENPPTADAGR